MTMVERVARALCWEVTSRYLERSGVMAINPERIEDAVDRCWEEHTGDARAAIKAMREPTEEMIQAGYSADTQTGEPIKAYRGMIDEALKDG